MAVKHSLNVVGLSQSDAPEYEDCNTVTFKVSRVTEMALLGQVANFGLNVAGGVQ
jgi:hypothetical protein